MSFFSTIVVFPPRPVFLVVLMNLSSSSFVIFLWNVL